MDVELLITKVRERTPLWDKRNKHHANRNIVNKLWSEVVKELDCEGKQNSFLMCECSPFYEG